MERTSTQSLETQELRRSVPSSLRNYFSATLLVAALTGLFICLNLDLSAANRSMLYLAVVIVSALFLGRGAAIWTSLLSFLCVNWFFVLPHYTFSVKDPSDWLSLWMFLITAIVTGQLMAQLRAREALAREHQRRTEILSGASWAVASQLDTRSALTEVLKQISNLIELKAIAISSGENSDDRIVTDYPEGAFPFSETHIDNTSSSPSSEIISRAAPIKTDSGFVTIIPLCVEGNQLGRLLVLRLSAEPLSEDQSGLVAVLANHASIILQRHKLFQSEAQARVLADANKLKTALLSMVSHDFRSPLTSIKASATTLLDYGEPAQDDSSGNETVRSLCQGIVQETDRLNRMVGNILDLSRLESHAWTPKLEPIPMSELAGMILSGFSQSENSRIELFLDPKLEDVQVDSVQITQVMKNLIENALKYSSGQVDVRMSKDGSQLILEVLDRGRGLSRQDLDHMFESFYRAADLEESAAPGVGIGLSVCKGLLEAHGGNLRAENREGGGSIFRATLPADESGVA